jgi:NAD(P)-dependent dehydrogenase (short-subunit alcohol dehydrogenase family)
MGALAEMSLADYQFVIDVNQTGTFLGLKTAIPLMVAAGGGAIVNIASAEGLQGTPGGGAYCASKHAVIGLTKTAAIEMAPAGIRVNAVCPGGVGTPMIDELSEAMGCCEQSDGEALRERVLRVRRMLIRFAETVRKRCEVGRMQSPPTPHSPPSHPR